MGPGQPANECNNEELLAEFESACRGGDYEYAPEYRDELIRRLSMVTEQENNRITLMQYENLRKHFHQLVTDVLGERYYNEGMDVYTCDEYCCRDLKSKLKRRWFARM